jgi:transposase
MVPSPESKGRGRPRTVDDPEKLARDLIIRICHQEGMSRRRLAKVFGLHPDSFRRIVRRVRQHQDNMKVS